MSAHQPFALRVWRLSAGGSTLVPGLRYFETAETFYAARAALAQRLGVDPALVRLDATGRDGGGET